MFGSSSSDEFSGFSKIPEGYPKISPKISSSSTNRHPSPSGHKPKSDHVSHNKSPSYTEHQRKRHSNAEERYEYPRSYSPHRISHTARSEVNVTSAKIQDNEGFVSRSEFQTAIASLHEAIKALSRPTKPPDQPVALSSESAIPLAGSSDITEPAVVGTKQTTTRVPNKADNLALTRSDSETPLEYSGDENPEVGKDIIHLHPESDEDIIGEVPIPPPITRSTPQGHLDKHSSSVPSIPPQAKRSTLSASVADIDGVDSAPEGVSEQDAWSFKELINLVYELLPPKHCPPQPPPEMGVRSITEDLIGELVHQLPKLPHSSTVASTASLISSSDTFKLGKKNFSVPSGLLKKLTMSGAYNIHSEQWPTKPPSLDKDASKIGISSVSRIRTHWKVIESVEAKLRTSVSMLSHADLFCAAAHMALQEGRDIDCVSSLIQAAARASRHAMGNSMALSTELLLMRRDAAIDASNILEGGNKERLRTAPLSSDKLFAGLCASVAEDDAAQRQRDQLCKPARTFTSGPKGNSTRNPSKGKGPRGRRVPPMGSRNPTPLVPRASTSSTPYKGRGRGRPSRSGFPKKGPLKTSQ